MPALAWSTPEVTEVRDDYDYPVNKFPLELRELVYKYDFLDVRIYPPDDRCPSPEIYSGPCGIHLLCSDPQIPRVTIEKIEKCCARFKKERDEWWEEQQQKRAEIERKRKEYEDDMRRFLGLNWAERIDPRDNKLLSNEEVWRERAKREAKANPIKRRV